MASIRTVFTEDTLSGREPINMYAQYIQNTYHIYVHCDAETIPFVCQANDLLKQLDNLERVIRDPPEGACQITFNIESYDEADALDRLPEMRRAMWNDDTEQWWLEESIDSYGKALERWQMSGRVGVKPLIRKQCLLEDLVYKMRIDYIVGYIEFNLGTTRVAPAQLPCKPAVITKPTPQQASKPVVKRVLRAPTAPKAIARTAAPLAPIMPPRGSAAPLAPIMPLRGSAPPAPMARYTVKQRRK